MTQDASVYREYPKCLARCGLGMTGWKHRAVPPNPARTAARSRTCCCMRLQQSATHSTPRQQKVTSRPLTVIFEFKFLQHAFEQTVDLRGDTNQLRKLKKEERGRRKKAPLQVWSGDDAPQTLCATDWRVGDRRRGKAALSETTNTPRRTQQCEDHSARHTRAAHKTPWLVVRRRQLWPRHIKVLGEKAE